MGKTDMKRMTLRRLAATMLLVATCWATCWAVVPLVAQTQPPSPAQEGFVPIDQLQPKEQLPAAPLVMAAYAVAWVVIFGYVWSIWRRLGKVEQDIASVSQRVSGGARR
jgi:CcmD family protein